MRVRSTLNWAFLCINAVLFLLLVWTLFPRRDRAYVLARKVAAGFREAAPELEMDVYCSKDPFAVLVDRDFPRKERFSVLIRGRPFFVSAEDALADDAEATKQVNIAFGRDFSLGCDYSTADGPKVRRITLFTNGAYLTDLNADGPPTNACGFQRSPPRSHRGQKCGMKVRGGRLCQTGNSANTKHNCATARL